MSSRIGRREFMARMTAIGASGAFGTNLFSAGFGQSPSGPSAAARVVGLPARGEFVVRNAYVMTMDPTLGDVSPGHIHVRKGDIIAVGSNVQAPAAAVIDGRGMIALPGMVETHWHMWNTLLRSFDGDTAANGYFPRTAAYGKAMTPDDMYQSTRWATAEALYSGVTTAHDYCHNVQSRPHAEAGIRAFRQAGLRGRWSYGWPQGYPDTKLIDLPTLEEIHKDWSSLSGDGVFSLGFGWRGMFRPSGPLPPEIYRREFDAARAMDLPISVHVGSAEGAKGQVGELARKKLLGRDVQLLHALSATDAELKMVADAGSVVSVSPRTEMRIGYGLPHLAEILNAGITTGISIDTLVLGGNANFFELLNTARNVESGRNHDEFKISARRMIELGTIEGARSLGIDNLTGSLKPGKRADLILVSTHSLNLGPITDPAQMIVEAALPENVDTVIVDGRILKRGGKLTALSEDVVLEGVSTSLAALRKRVGT
jgi:cytosine/adenosine deaminase-related metal-dependent hydrolase